MGHGHQGLETVDALSRRGFHKLFARQCAGA